ncbi:MAG: nuclear transport factor 2 family protein [Nitrospinae bacterium]|nr:nuclear transport factor 2 family protein [Nitrospinota bacterium]
MVRLCFRSKGISKVFILFSVFCLLLTAYCILPAVVIAAPLQLPPPEAYKITKRDSKDFKEIKAVFENLIAAGKKTDLGGIMSFFSKNYLNSGRDISDAMKQWKQIVDHFVDLELQHPIYQIEISGNFAKIRCEGVLLGIPKGRDEVVEIDSWKLAVHNVIKEDGKWKILGDQVSYDTGRTFHPLF